MHLNIKGVIFQREIDATIGEGQTKSFPLGSEENDTVAIFGVDEGKTPWYASGKNSMVHIDGGPVTEREGIVGKQSVRIGDRIKRDNYVTAIEMM